MLKHLVVGLLFVACSPVFANDDGRGRCSNATINGNYGFSMTGSIQPIGNVALSGTIRSDGHGSFSGGNGERRRTNRPSSSQCRLHWNGAVSTRSAELSYVAHNLFCYYEARGRVLHAQHGTRLNSFGESTTLVMFFAAHRAAQRGLFFCVATAASMRG